MTPNTVSERHRIESRSPANRSRVTNGKTLFAIGGDMRRPWARRLRDCIEMHLGDLGSNVSEAERSIVRRAAVLTVELERLEAKFAVDQGTVDDLDLYQRTAGSLRRLLESVGLKRRPRDVQTLDQYLSTHYGPETRSGSSDDEAGVDDAEIVDAPAGDGARPDLSQIESSTATELANVEAASPPQANAPVGENGPAAIGRLGDPNASADPPKADAGVSS
jgi:hypothetical protein